MSAPKYKLLVEVTPALTLAVPISPDSTVEQLLATVAKRAAKKLGVPLRIMQCLQLPCARSAFIAACTAACATCPTRACSCAGGTPRIVELLDEDGASLYEEDEVPPPPRRHHGRHHAPRKISAR